MWVRLCCSKEQYQNLSCMALKRILSDHPKSTVGLVWLCRVAALSPCGDLAFQAASVLSYLHINASFCDLMRVRGHGQSLTGSELNPFYFFVTQILPIHVLLSKTSLTTLPISMGNITSMC